MCASIDGDNNLARCRIPYFRNLDMQFAKSLRSTSTREPRMMIIVYAWKGQYMTIHALSTMK